MGETVKVTSTMELRGRTEDMTGHHAGCFYIDFPLRDLFAAFALAGLIAQSDKAMPVETFAKEAFSVADAMLSARGTDE